MVDDSRDAAGVPGAADAAAVPGATDGARVPGSADGTAAPWGDTSLPGEQGLRQASSEPLVVTFGTAVGAAMLGFEEALRREPPAQVMAAEHTPERGRIAADGGLLIEIPDPVAPPRPGSRRPSV